MTSAQEETGAATYRPGSTLYATSSNHCSGDLCFLEPLAADKTLRKLVPRMFDTSNDNAIPRPQTPPVIYQLRAIQSFAPYTMSVVCRVRLTGVFLEKRAIAPIVPLPADPTESAADSATDDIPPGPEYILKLYDRRCYGNVRKEYDGGKAYSETKARAYKKYLAGDPVQSFPREFEEMQGLSGDKVSNETDMGLFEAWLENDAQETRIKETQVYNLLGELQGVAIPRLYDTVSCITSYRFPPSSDSEQAHADPLGLQLAKVDSAAPDQADPRELVDRHLVKGILLEYVRGSSLRSFIPSLLDSPLPKEAIVHGIACIASEAVALVLRIGTYPVLNWDWRLDNMLVRDEYLQELLSSHAPITPASNAEHQRDSLTSTSGATDMPLGRVVAIDFGHVRFRFDDETDEQWRCAKYAEDEETAIGWELLQLISDSLKKRGAESSPIGVDTMEKWDAKEKIWEFKPVNPWYRELSPEEQLEYERCPSWGEHPNSWTG